MQINTVLQQVVRFGLLAVGAVGIIAGWATAQDEPLRYYYHKGERIAVQVASDQLSVGLKEGRGMSTVQHLSLPSGTLKGTVRPLVGNHRLVILGDAVADDTSRRLGGGITTDRLGQQGGGGGGEPARGVWADSSHSARLQMQSEALRAIRTDNSVSFAYRALTHAASGGVLYPTPLLIIQVAGGLSEAEVRVKLPPEIAMVRQIRLSEGQFIVRLVDPSQDHPLDWAARLSEEFEWVDWAAPDFVQTWRRSGGNATPPNDPYYASQWHIKNTGQGSPPGTVDSDARLEQAWATEAGDGTVVIAIIDDGVQYDNGSTVGHPDLQDRIFTNPGETANGLDDDGNGYIDDLHGWDFSEGDNDPNPLLTGGGSHGTAVAGVAAAIAGNAEGTAGACQNCLILPVRIFGDSGASTTNSNIAEAIRYGGQFAEILNNSWGGGSPSSAITTAIQEVTSQSRSGKGAVVLAASGNSASGFTTLTLSGFDNGTYTFQWEFLKDSVTSAGFDSAWLDDVNFPDGTVETFEDCTALPTGWTSSGAALWGLVNQEIRASSRRGGSCAARAGAIPHGQTSNLTVTRTFSGLPGGGASALVYRLWVSAERKGTGNGTGLQITDSCWDGARLRVFDGSSNDLGTFLFRCGTYSNQDSLLADGTVAYPASLSQTIAVGAATNFDRRSDYSQWGSTLDVVAHSSGGSLGIFTADVVGVKGYSPADGSTNSDDYTETFGGTSSATPLAAGIAGLLLTINPTLTAEQVRGIFRISTRQIGTVAYLSSRNDQYGYGALDASQVMTNAFNPPAVVSPAADPTVTDPEPVPDPVVEEPPPDEPVSEEEAPVVEEEPAPTDSSADSGDSGQGDASINSQLGCLISYSTAGWLEDRQLNFLRVFRHWLLHSGPAGRSLVRTYYRISGSIIAVLEDTRQSRPVLGKTAWPPDRTVGMAPAW